MSHKPKPKQSDNDDLQKNKLAITLALISLIGVILTALITAFAEIYPTIASRTPSPQPLTSTPVTPSLVANTDLPGETPTFVTQTAVPSVTDSPIIPVPLGDDWIQGCISSAWMPYPSTVQPVETGKGCWKEPVYMFSAENGDLDFLFERARGAPEIYGLFAPLPEAGTVTVTIRLRELSNTDLWMGVFNAPDLTSQGLLLTILNGDVKSRPVIQRNPINYETIQGTKTVQQGNGYSISFRFDTLSVTGIVNPAVFSTNSFSMPSAQKWLFLGYKGLNGYYRIEGRFLNFELTQ